MASLHHAQSFENWMDPKRQADLHATVVIGAAEEVHRVLGPGYGDGVYKEAMWDELLLRGVPYIKKPILAVKYKGRKVGEQQLDLLVGDGVIVEMLSIDGLEPRHAQKMMSYLKATSMALGLLINFNVPQMTFGIKRVQPV